MIVKLLLLFLALQYSGNMSQAAPLPEIHDLSSVLNKRVTNYSLGEVNLIEAMIRVSNDFQIPVGIAWVDSPTARTKTLFTWKSATVQEIIENIVKTQQSYKVRVENGVVHISPARDLMPDNENFLKLRLESFEIHDDIVELASIKLHMLVTPRKYGQISIGGTGDSSISVQLKDCTVGDALDAISVASNRKIWVVTFSDNPGVTSRGLRRSLSLWSGATGADEEQPSWDFLRWGDRTPPITPEKRSR